MAYKYPGNQVALQDIHWLLCADDGRHFLAELIGGRAAFKTLNTQMARGGSQKGNTSLGSFLAWNDDHVVQTLAAVAASKAEGGASIADIEQAVKDALAESVVKVSVNVEGTGVAP